MGIDCTIIFSSFMGPSALTQKKDRKRKKKKKKYVRQNGMEKCVIGCKGVIKFC